MDERQRLPKPDPGRASVAQRLSIMRGADSPAAEPTPGDAGLLTALRRRKWALVVPLLVVPAAAIFFSLQQDARYEAEAKVLLSRTSSSAWKERIARRARWPTWHGRPSSPVGS